MTKRFLSTTMTALVLSGVLLAAGCGDDDDSSTDPETLPAEDLSAAAQMTGAASAMWMVSSTAAATRQVLTTRPHAVDICPQAATSRPDSSHWVVTLDFGTACSLPGGSVASGALVLTYATATDPEGLEIAFEDFAVEDLALDGTLTASGLDWVWTFVYAGTATGPGGTTQITGTFELTIDPAGTLMDATDDVIRITGSGVVTLNGASYTLTIDEDLLFSAECALPYAGQLTYRAQASPARPATTIDFSPGDCCAVEVTIGALSEEVDLCSIE